MIDPSPHETNAAAPGGKRHRRWWLVLKWGLFLLVLGFVGRRAWVLWETDRAPLDEVRVQWAWLLPAATAYLAGWLPSVWFWRRLMHRMGGDLRFRDTARAYYCGHLGKYVPGKASVLVIRAALLKDRGFRPAPAALTVAYETLVMMGAGLAVAAALSPLLVGGTAAVPDWLGWLVARPVLPAVAVATVCLLLLPVLSLVFSYVAERMTPADLLVAHGPVKIDSPLLGAGLLAFAGGWALHGLSLGLTLRAVSDGPFALADWPLWTAATAFATVVGFAAIFAPGGLGVREGLLIGILGVQPHIGNQQAIAAAVLLRAVWFTAEILAAAVLYYTIRPRPE